MFLDMRKTIRQGREPIRILTLTKVCLLLLLFFSGRGGGVLHLLGAVPRAAPPLRHVLPLRVEVRLRGNLPGQSVGHGRQTRNVVVCTYFVH